MSAVLEGHVAIVRLLLEAGADVGERSEAYGHSLEIAAAQGQLEIVQLLLEFGADIDQAGVHHVNAVQASSIHGHAGVVQHLLDHGAKLSATAEDAGPPSPSLQTLDTEAIENRPQQQTIVSSPATHAQAQIHGSPRYEESPNVTSSPQDSELSISRRNAPQRSIDGDVNASQSQQSLPSIRTSPSALITDAVVRSSNVLHLQLPNAPHRPLNNPFEPEHYNRVGTDSALHEEYSQAWEGHDYSMPPLPDFVPQSVHHDNLSSPPAIQISKAPSAHDAGTGVGILTPEPLTAPGRRPKLSTYEKPLLPPPTGPAGVYTCTYPGCTDPPFPTQYLLE